MEQFDHPMPLSSSIDLKCTPQSKPLPMRKMRHHFVFIALMMMTALGFSTAVYGQTSETFAIADYPAGSQYAVDEMHVLSPTVTIYTTQCHFTNQLIVYSSITHNGFFYSNELPYYIDSLAFNIGNNADNLNVFGSNDGNTWTLVGFIATTTAYADKGIKFGEDDYKYFKCDVGGTKQLSIVSMTIFYKRSVENVLTENFESTSIPTDWTQSGENWNFGIAAAACQGTYGAAIQENAEYLISPVMDLAGFDAEVSFSYKWLEAAGAYGAVYYRNTSADAWTMIGSTFSTSADCQRKTVTIPLTSATCQIAIAKTGGTNTALAIDSVVITKEELVVEAPTFSPVAGVVCSGTEVTLSCATPGAAIYYTTDGSTPDGGSTLCRPKKSGLFLISFYFANL